MAVLNALHRTLSALRRSPVLFVPILVVSLLQMLQLVLRPSNPLLNSVVSLGSSIVFIVITPFIQGGLVAMANEALDGHTALQTFINDGKANYVSLLVAYLVLMAINFVLGIIVFFVALFSGALFLGVGSLESANIAALAAIGIIVAIIALLYILAFFFFQFYSQAIVLDDKNAIDGLKHSVSVVRQHIVSTLGYSILVGVLGGVLGGVFGVLVLLLLPELATVFGLPELSLMTMVVVGLLLLVIETLFGGFFRVYSVSFYREITR